MPKLTLVSNVAEFGLFRSLATTRPRLIASALTAGAATAAVGFGSAHYAMRLSSSVVLNMGLITLNMLLVMISAYLLALLAGDLFFPGPWREQIILGDRSYRDDVDADVSVQDHNAEFLILWFLLVLGQALLINTLSGGFFTTYNEEGYFLTRMRSEAVEDRLAALRELSDPMNVSLWENETLHEVILDGLEDVNGEVREQAAWTAGKLKLTVAQPALLELLQDREAPVDARGEAALALGRIGANEVALQALLDALQTGDSELKVWALRGLAAAKAPGVHDAIATWHNADDEELVRHVFYALRVLEDPDTRPWVRAQLELAPGGARECMLLDTYKMVANEQDVVWARRRFMEAPKEKMCERVVWEERDEAQHVLVFGDSHRLKYVKIVANSGKGREYMDWFQRIINDAQEETRVREVASQIVMQFKR
ncbi:MAG: HEAT repeat domain-containing protein [Myxococcota bacterium]